MADLKALYMSLGLKNVETYIQSGNVVFGSSNTNLTEMRTMIETAIETHYGFYVSVLLRTKTEFERVVAGCPFGDLNLEEEGARVLVSFLASSPTEENISDIKQYVVEPEKLIIVDKEAYLHCPNGYGKTKLSNPFIESKLGVSATTRNWKTVIKLNEMVGN